MSKKLLIATHNQAKLSELKLGLQNLKKLGIITKIKPIKYKKKQVKILTRVNYFLMKH